MSRTLMRVTAPVALAVFGVWAALFLISGTALAANQCVAPGGAGECKASIQAAINAANPGNTVRVVAGVYTENVDIAKDIVLIGGYDDTSLTTRTPRSSTVNGNHNGSVIRIWNGAEVTVDGFTITGGDATNQGGEGGGIYAEKGTVQIVDNLVTGNVASSQSAIFGAGGGIYIIGTSKALVSDNTIEYNAAYSATLAGPDDAQGGLGGGLWLYDVSGTVVTGNIVRSNTAAHTNMASPQLYGAGGGLGVQRGSATLDSNEVRGNVGAQPAGNGNGGGIDLYNFEAITLTNNIIVENTSAMWATEGGGGGVTMGLLDGSGQRVTLRGNQILSNTAVYTLAANQAHAYGGGLQIGCEAKGVQLTLADNLVAGNTTARSVIASGSHFDVDVKGGGVEMYGVATVIVTGNEVRGNVVVERYDVTGDGSGQWGGGPTGGGMALENGKRVTVDGNLFADNVTIKEQTVTGAGTGANAGGLSLRRYAESLVSSNEFLRNTAVVSGSLSGDADENYGIAGGGLNIESDRSEGAQARVEDNRFAGNVAAVRVSVKGDAVQCHPEGGGMTIRGISQTVIAGNVFEANVAVRNLSLRGDGSKKWGGRPAGGGLYASESYSMTLRHNQFLDNITAIRHTVRDVESGSEGGGFAMINVDDGAILDNTVLRNTALVTGSMTSNAGEYLGAQGGGMMLACWDNPACEILVQGNDISGNLAAQALEKQGSDAQGGANGGGLNLARSQVTLRDNVIAGNLSLANGNQGGGGAIDVYDATVTMERNRILGNHSTTTGDGLAVNAYEGRTHSVNDVFAHNTGGFGSHGDSQTASATLINDTFYDNGGVAINASNNAVFTVTNTIVFSHDVGLNIDGPAALTGDYNLLDNQNNYGNGVTPGSHDITDEAPDFVDAAVDDFHLSGASPAIDAGDNAAAPLDDFEGDPRPVDGDNDGTPVADIGADEFTFSTVHLPSVFK